MTKDEKVRAYDKALERAKDMLSYKEVRREDMEYLFPELAESEDVRIANAIRRHLDMEKCERNLTGYFGVSYKEAVAWLEKQGEKTLSIRWHSVGEEPQEMRELLVEWDSGDATWHDAVFYHADDRTFWDCERQIENVTRWCYIDNLIEK